MVSNGTKLKIVQSNTTGLANSSKYDNDALIIDVSGSGIYLGNGSSSPIKLASNVDETTVTEWGFTKTTGTYSKPSTGIPKSDLASDVQTSLGKADSAIQGNGTIKNIVKVSSLPSNPDASTLYIVL